MAARCGYLSSGLRLCHRGWMDMIWACSKAPPAPSMSTRALATLATSISVSIVAPKSPSSRFDTSVFCKESPHLKHTHKYVNGDQLGFIKCLLVKPQTPSVDRGGIRIAHPDNVLRWRGRR